MLAATESRLCDADAGWPQAHDSAPLLLRIMEYVGANALVKRLIAEHPEKAADILARCYEDRKVSSEVMSCFLQSTNGQHEILRSPNSVANIFPPRTPARSSSSQHSGSPPPRHRVSRHPSSDARLFTLSHSRTASSTTSRSARDEVNLGEYILLLDLSDMGVEEKLVRMKTAQIRHSIIREDVAHKRSLNASINQEEETQVFVPCTSNPEDYTEIRVSESITLIWRRPNSNSTHSTTFFLVSKNVLNTDVVLGYEDSGEGSSGVYTCFPCNCTKPFD